MRRSRPKRPRSWRSRVADDLLAQIRLNGPVPRHVAIIMDGNGRWARERNLPRPFGHRAGMKAVREVVEGAIEAGGGGLPLFAFSDQNWQRPPPEVSAGGRGPFSSEDADRKSTRPHSQHAQVS